MEQTFQALGGILVKAIPTVILLILLHWYLKAMLFAPLRKVLSQREALTEGARKAAQDSLSAAERKASEYEAKLADARAEVYREQEEIRKRWLEDQATQTAQAQANAEKAAKDARFEVASEAAAARKNLLETSAGLAEQIANTVLSRRHE